MPRLVPLLLLALTFAGCRTDAVPAPPPGERPNLLVVLADDLGYSDLGAYGSEIPTPNLDARAKAGLRASDFYVAPSGAPTRAMLLTGLDSHLALERGAGVDSARLAPGATTVASRLAAAGYRTVFSGKWELGGDPADRPAARGFERSFALVDGAASHWADRNAARPGHERALYTRDGAEVEMLAPEHYSSRAFADFLIEALDGFGGDAPFFAVLAFQAPHGPLAVPDDWRDRAASRYDVGYDAIRSARLLRMKRAKLLGESVQPYPGLPTVPRWKELPPDQRLQQARKMELYAAMVENLDFQVGRVVDHLRERGELDHTLFVFLSDNGAEAGDRGVEGMDHRQRDFYAARFPEFGMEHWGRPGSFVEVGPAWAQVSMTPFRLFKGTLAEGGIRSPLIVSGPGVGGSDRVVRQVLHVTDLAPTLLEWAGAPEPGREAPTFAGQSLAAVLAGGWRKAAPEPHAWLGFAQDGSRAVRRGPWKLIEMPRPFGAGRWRLYHLGFDPAELYDESEARPETSRELAALWEEYALAIGARAPEPMAQKSRPSAR